MSENIISDEHTGKKVGVGYASEVELLKDLKRCLKEDPTNSETASNYLLNSLVEDMILGIALEVHHTVRVGSANAMEGQPEDSNNEMPDFDVFGSTTTKKAIECNCPQCDRLVAASRFAPHLENCMGMGRNSSRIASRRLATRERTTNFFASHASDDDDDVDWAGEKRKRKSMQNVRSNGSKKNGKSS